MDNRDDHHRDRRMRLPSYLINQASIPARRLVSEGLATIDARRHHYSLLAALEEFGPASQALLGRRCGIDRSDIVAAVNELAAMNLVDRFQDPTDRRRNVITITPAGIERLQKLDDVLAGIQDELLAPLTSEEREELVRLLARLVLHHKPAP